MKKLAAELFGTFALVFAGTGGIGVALTFGLIVLAMICAWGRLRLPLEPGGYAGLPRCPAFPGPVRLFLRPAQFPEYSACMNKNVLIF